MLLYHQFNLSTSWASQRCPWFLLSALSLSLSFRLSPSLSPFIFLTLSLSLSLSLFIFLTLSLSFSLSHYLSHSVSFFLSASLKNPCSSKFCDKMLAAAVPSRWLHIYYIEDIFQVFLSVISGINMLRGFLIFIIFIWKPSVWRKIVKKHPKLAKVIQIPVQYICCSKLAQDNAAAEHIPMQPLRSTTEQNTLKLSVRFATKKSETVNCE